MQLKEGLHPVLGQQAPIQEHTEQQDVACQVLWLFLVDINVDGAAVTVAFATANGVYGVPCVIRRELHRKGHNKCCLELGAQYAFPEICLHTFCLHTFFYL